MGELTRYSLKEVAKQDGNDGASVWIVINDLVYDVTVYRNKHPGGAELIEEYAGQDATRGFKGFGHSSDAKKELNKHLIGELIEDDKAINRKKNANSDNKSTTIRSKRRFLSILCGNCA